MEQKDKSSFDNLVNHAEEYFETRQELAKLIIVQKTSKVASGIFSSLVLFIVFFFAVVFLSLAIAFIISTYSGIPYLGHLCIAGLYILIGMILYAKRKSLLQDPVANAMIKNFFNAEDHE